MAIANAYLKPMLDVGSPRVFNCNELTARIVAKDENAARFFRNKPLNTAVLIKDTVPEADRPINARPIGTKLYFPFNENNIYEGGRTIFLHEAKLEKAIVDHYGEGALPKEALAEDLRIMSVLDRLPSLDPFLMKDAFRREGLTINDSYFEVSAETWAEIEAFMLQQFEPLVKAAFPDAMGSDERARALMDTIWEARDVDALKPLIDGLRLPAYKALDIFSSWRGIVYYSYHHQLVQTRLIELIKWLKLNDGVIAGKPPAEGREMVGMLKLVGDQLRSEWQTVDGVVRKYRAAYDKMFKTGGGSADFLAFLNGSNETYWRLGNAIGKVNHGLYCWEVMTQRFAQRKLPWSQLQDVMRLLTAVFEPEKVAKTAVNW